MLKIMRAPEKIVQLVSFVWLTQRWATVFEVRSAAGIQCMTVVKYWRGLFQGDALSPPKHSAHLDRAQKVPQGIEVGQRGVDMVIIGGLWTSKCTRRLERM